MILFLLLAQSMACFMSISRVIGTFYFLNRDMDYKVITPIDVISCMSRQTEIS